jgi:hypothetical protein
MSKEDKYPIPCTKYIVRAAMKQAEKDVRIPKCVRDGIVKPIKKKKKVEKSE